MKKTVYFVEDVIWVLRDLYKNNPVSIFDNDYLNTLKIAHDKFGTKTQLNLFYSTDNFYGNDDFNLSQMPSKYKKEFLDNSDWLKFAFHARQEFPDYPYVNGNYDQVKEDFLKVKAEVIRFADEKCWTNTVVAHWLSMSYDACKALKDCGVKLISATNGEKYEFNGDPNSLPFGHYARLLQDRKAETMVMKRNGENFLCSHNHSVKLGFENTAKTLDVELDEKTGLYFKKLNDIIINCHTLESLISTLNDSLGDEYIGIGNHEQYYYSDYIAYQSDYSEKVLKTAELISNAGYEYIFLEDLVK